MPERATPPDGQPPPPREPARRGLFDVIPIDGDRFAVVGPSGARIELRRDEIRRYLGERRTPP